MVNLEFLRRKELILLVTFAALFLLLRLPAVHQPYHQDEYKWPMYANPAIFEPGAVVHPPLAELVYRKIGPVVDYNNFRFIPLAFSLVNLFLIFYLAKIIFDKRAAFWSAFLFAVSFYSVLASLMVDVDGAVMPFFFLIFLISYFELKKRNFKFQISNFKFWIWTILLVVGAIGGFLVKVSGILPIFAIFLDFLIEKSVFSDKKKVFKYAGFGILGLLGLTAVLFAAKYIFPFFPLEKSFKYWSHFANSSSFLGRGWFQTFVQFIKSLLYTSPLLVLPVFFADKEMFKKLRPFFLFIFIGLFFYLFAFDFSTGALDRYFQFLIIPLCIICGAVFAKYLNYKLKIINYAIPIILSLAIFLFQFFNHYIPPLYPKTEWIERILLFKWNFLFPFIGGSGPAGFYVSFLSIAFIWICSVLFIIVPKIQKIKPTLLGILIFGLLYNGVFIEEYLFGKINGSPYGLFKEAKEFIVKNSSIEKVVVYNDIGGYEIQKTGKYERRLYTAPQFEETYREFFSGFSGHILYIDIPRMGDNNFYSDYLNSCESIYKETDKYITAQIFDCQKTK